MNTIKHQNQHIIRQLQTLKSVKANNAFKWMLYKTFVPTRTSLVLSTAWRLAVIVLLVLFIGGGSVVIVSAHSKPGDVFYPIKKFVEKVIHPLTGETQEMENNPEAATSRDLETATSVEVPLDNQDPVAIMTPTPTPSETEPTLTPTPSPTPTDVPDVSARVNVLGTGISVGLGSNQLTETTPTPQSVQNFLPPANIDVSLNKKPLLHIGL